MRSVGRYGHGAAVVVESDEGYSKSVEMLAGSLARVWLIEGLI